MNKNIPKNTSISDDTYKEIPKQEPIPEKFKTEPSVLRKISQLQVDDRNVFIYMDFQTTKYQFNGTQLAFLQALEIDYFHEAIGEMINPNSYKVVD